MYDIAILTILLILLIFIIAREKWNEGFQTANFPDRERAEQILRDTNSRLIKFLEFLKIKFRINVVGPEPMTRAPYIEHPRARQVVERILHNYRGGEVIFENDPRYDESTSYCVDKGRKLYICIRDRKTHKFIEPELIFFVVLHEISHIGNTTWGHDAAFWETFKFILDQAKKSGLYHPVNYAHGHVNYCGLEVTYNPLYDDNIPNWWLSPAGQ